MAVITDLSGNGVIGRVTLDNRFPPSWTLASILIDDKSGNTRNPDSPRRVRYVIPS